MKDSTFLKAICQRSFESSEMFLKGATETLEMVLNGAKKRYKAENKWSTIVNRMLRFFGYGVGQLLAELERITE